MRDCNSLGNCFNSPFPFSILSEAQRSCFPQVKKLLQKQDREVGVQQKSLKIEPLLIVCQCVYKKKKKKYTHLSMQNTVVLFISEQNQIQAQLAFSPLYLDKRGLKLQSPSPLSYLCCRSGGKAVLVWPSWVI